MAGKALITGGAGFIGSHLAEQLLDLGWEVFALDDLTTGAHRNVEQLRERTDFHLVVDSVLSPSVVSELVYKCDVVFHLAAAVGVRLIVEQPVHTMVTNVQGTETVLEYCNKFGKRVLSPRARRSTATTARSARSSENDRRVYGPVTERRWLYADSKAIDEFLALGFHQERGLDCVIARFFNTVGPRQSGQYGMVIPRFVERAIADAPLEVHGDGMQTRSFCHVSDTVRAVVGMMEARDDLRRDLQHRLGGARPDPRSRGARVELTGSSRSSRSSPTRRSTASGSRTCCTASRRSRRSATRSGGARRST